MKFRNHLYKSVARIVAIAVSGTATKIKIVDNSLTK
jgi:hypothetical protein